MDSGTSLMLILVFSAVGMGYFSYGKKQRHNVALVAGIALMVYPYFVTNVLPIILIGVVLMALPFVIKI